MTSPRSQFQALSLLAISLMAASPLKATIIDGSVPATMNDGGTSANPAEYVIGAMIDPPSSPDTVTHTGDTKLGGSTSWNNLTIQNGWQLVTTNYGYVGGSGTSSNNHVVVNGAGSAWDVLGTRFYLGAGNNNSILITNGASFSLAANSQFQIGNGANATGNSFTISNNSSVTQGTGASVYVGYLAGASGNSFVVKNGASYSLGGGIFTIGANATGQTNNHLDVSGANTRVSIGTPGTGTLTIGISTTTGNYALVEDRALLQLSDPNPLRFTIATGNYMRLAEGYFAIAGDQVAKLKTMIGAGNFQIWDGTSWQVETDFSKFELDYFASAQDALAYSGYSGLGNYTILYAIPEPGAVALLALGAGLFAFIRRRKGTAPLV